MALNPHAVIHHASNPFHLGIVPPALVIVLSIGGLSGVRVKCNLPIVTSRSPSRLVTVNVTNSPIFDKC